jgi:hypothetical protein
VNKASQISRGDKSRNTRLGRLRHLVPVPALSSGSTEDFLVVLNEAIVRAEVGLTPGCECTWSEDFTGADEASGVLEGGRARGADYDLAFIPRSPVTGGNAWELQAGQGEVVVVASSLAAVVTECVAETRNGSARGT